MVTGKADSLELLEGMSPDVLWQTSRHHRRLRAGHVHKGVARELERTANSSWESIRTSTANRFNKRPGVCRNSQPCMRAKNTNRKREPTEVSGSE